MTYIRKDKTVSVKWAGKLSFIGKGATGESLVMDAGAGEGGIGWGHSPMDLLLIGAGGCASIDVVMILQKGRKEISDCEVEVFGERADEMPKKYTKIHMHFKVSGKDLKAAVVERAVNLSMEKYCSASATLAGGVEMTFDWEVVE